MPFLVSQSKKSLIVALTSSLFVFSSLMLVFDDSDASLKTKASSIHAAHVIP
jgi:hypothetical protein